jgi:hypothetical protein
MCSAAAPEARNAFAKDLSVIKGTSNGTSVADIKTYTIAAQPCVVCSLIPAEAPHFAFLKFARSTARSAIVTQSESAASIIVS